METTINNKWQPTFGDSFSKGWKVMSDSFLYLFLVVVLMGFLNAPTSMMQFKFDISNKLSQIGFIHFDHFDPDYFRSIGPFVATLGALAFFFAALAFAYSLLVLPVFRYGSKMIFVQAARQQKPDFNKLFNGFKENYFQIVLANLLTTALIMIGFFMIIVPGIIIACRLVFVPYLIMDKNLDPIKAVEESWRITRGKGWTIFAMAIVSFLIIIGGFLLCLVGLFPAFIWVGSSFACMYESLVQRDTPVAPTPEVNIQA